MTDTQNPRGTPPILLEVWRDGMTGSIQVSIGEKDGTGFRLLGPKFIGQSERLAYRELTDRDADELADWCARIREQGHAS